MASQKKTILTLLEKKENQLKEEEKNHRNGEMKKHLKKQLKEVQAAKKRLEDATYGFCEKCYKSIPWRELCDMPEKRLCDNCTPSRKAS
jgi:RNA polymerase-binding transcription factor DksA